MNGTTFFRLGLGIGALTMGLSALWAQQPDSVDVSGFPPEVQKQYKTFTEKCSKCHDLSRPLSAKYTTEAQWRDMVSRMARKPGASISRKDQGDITSFLVYYQKSRSGSAPPASGTTTAATGSGAAAPTPEASPLPPASHSEAAAAGGGLRVEVDALPAQPITSPVEGRWTTEAPGAGENLFLSVRLFDAATGEKVPYAAVRARIGGDSGPAAKPLRPLFGEKGFQYGGNFAAPPGDLQVSLDVDPPPLARVNDDGHRWASPLNLKLTLHTR